MKKEKKKYKLNIPRIVVLLLAVLLIGSVFISIKNIITLRAERDRLIEANKQLIEEKKDLDEELKNVNNTDYIEEQARLQLRMVKPGETLFIIEDEEDDTEDTKNE